MQKSKGTIFLYGETHYVEAIHAHELELWRGHYAAGLRHLFVEMPYFMAELLNMWMSEDSDHTLLTMYDECSGFFNHQLFILDFYRAIKRDTPETVFHGTDVGRAYAKTIKRYLNRLEMLGEENSMQYQNALENFAQGEYFYETHDRVYREHTLVKNFIREFDSLRGESIMGIYGAGHTWPFAMDATTNSVPCMANQLRQRYSDALQTEDLRDWVKPTEPLDRGKITINEKTYATSYFARQDNNKHPVYLHREFWRVENAYTDFASAPTTGDVLPYSNFPMKLEPSQIFMVIFTRTDGTQETKFYRDDGTKWQGRWTTVEINV